METVRLEQQVASAERGVAFLKQEHLAMLTGLQLEIRKLRRRCQELCCELDTRYPDRAKDEKEAELAARCLAAERLLAEQQCMLGVACMKLRQRQARAAALGRSLKQEERHFLDELKRRGHKITSLSRELQRQNFTTTALCQELHAAQLLLYKQSRGEAGQAREEVRAETEDGETGEGETGEGETEEGEREEGVATPLRLYQQNQGEGDENGEDEEEEDEDEEDDEDWLLSPPPPSSPSQLEGRRRVRDEWVRACVPQEVVTSPRRACPMPDPAFFLYPLRQRLLPWNRPIRVQEREGGADRRGGGERVDMGGVDGETAL
ncbi:neurofilament light polypeptide [Esox lucius]|uniref:CCDC92/74 N-terminal domain-containing protein n=1 Tax=Esox lucius TaxID=8010 RepID=A0A3P8XL17_ESOLU|nr:neurofilament light polypeptide [Esox lucius]